MKSLRRGVTWDVVHKCDQNKHTLLYHGRVHALPKHALVLEPQVPLCVLALAADLLSTHTHNVAFLCEVLRMKR